MKSFAGQTAIYGIGELLPRAIGLVLLPLYANFLEPADYGLLAVLDMIGVYFGIVVNAGFSSTEFNRRSVPRSIAANERTPAGSSSSNRAAWVPWGLPE